MANRTKNRSYGGVKRKYNVNDSFFSNLNEVSAYWLGFLYADGYIDPKQNSSFLSISEKDLTHLERFKQDCGFEGPILKYKGAYSENHPITAKCRIRISSKEIRDKLIQFGCTPSKTLTCKFPELSEEVLPHFIRGYFDGDGSVSITKIRDRMKTPGIAISFIGTVWFLDILKYHLGFDDNKSLVKDKRLGDSPIRNLHISGALKAKAFYNYIYTNSTVFLERKKKKFDDFWNTKGRSETIIQPSQQG